MSKAPRDDGEVHATGLPPLRDCEALDLLGEGGMGAVYRARQALLKRDVALKMIHTSAGPRELALFRVEAEMAARLKHPHIVPIYEIGQRDGRPCLVLELVEGGSLHRKIAGKPQPGRAAAQLVQTLALAMHYAHEQGVVHCDLKPANVLLTADGTPKITDFGIARLLEARDGAPDEGAVRGTPSYMAPEQAAGKVRLIGPRTDVYALGAILYELLTGWPPFREATRQETLQSVLARRPIPPSLLQSRVHPDLETICLKCLEKAPRNRYATARELADDLGRYLASEPIEARPLNVVERTLRLVERPVHLEEVGSWGGAPLWDAGLAVAAHGVVYALVRTGQPVWVLWLWLIACNLLALWLFWYVLLQGRGGLSARERDLRNLWVGYGFAALTLLVIYCPPLGGARVADALHLYPPLAVVVGVILFAEGRMYWGRLYLVGLACFAVAVLMRWRPEWGPLLFGGLYALTVLYLGLHGRRAARESDREREKSPAQP